MGVRAHWLLYALAAVLNTGAHAADHDPTPLLSRAASQQLPPAYSANAQAVMKRHLEQILFQLSKDPPPETDCARTLGAKRFAAAFEDLGAAYSGVNEDANAVAAYSKAIACNPRAGFLHSQRAAAWLDMGQYQAAREETERQLTLGQASFSVYTLLTQLDFIENRWAEAVAHSRLAATEAPDDEQATYWQCFLWIAQKHTGARDPVLISRPLPQTWPGPILASLQGKIGEAQLTAAVAAERDGHRQREILTEALFYTGEKHLVENRRPEAIRYFQATADLQVPYFIEHHLALAELQKLRQPPAAN